MPIYEYSCAGCGSQEERIQPVGAPEAHDCPTCAAPGGMKRLISRTAFVLAGQGWYAGGYGEGPAKASAGEAAQGPAADAAKTEASASPAPAAPPVAPKEPGPGAPGPGNT